MDGQKVQLPEIKRQNDLPVVMSLEEVKKLINAPKYLKHRLIVATLYACGLRSYELCRSEEHTSELQSRPHLVCRLLLEKKKKKKINKKQKKKKTIKNTTKKEIQ